MDLAAPKGQLSIALVGAGAVGTYYGGRLAEAGEDVRFLLRSGYEAVRARGALEVRSVEGDFRVASPTIASSSSEIGPVDLVIVAWKATANAHYEEVLTPLFHEETVILTLQNGLGNTERLAELFGAERVMGGLCFVCINVLEPGVVDHIGGGLVALGEFAPEDMTRIEAVAERFERAGIKCRKESDLALAQWRKLVWNVPFNGLCITEGGVDTEALLLESEGEQRVRVLMGEVIEGAAALGHVIPPGFADEMIEVTLPMGAYRPSSMIDFVEGRAVEVEHIWREPLRRAKAAGARLPAWEKLLEEVEGCLSGRE
jgi:2-dehydropantoate 2-reductase